MNANSKPVRVVAGLVSVAVVVLAAVLGLRGGDTSDEAGNSAQVTAVATSAKSERSTGAAAVPVASPTRVPGVPDRAYVTLVEIDAGRWPDSANAPGTKGGEQWMNRNGDLPRTGPDGRALTYQEWDVNPKERNRSRDAERIVTGSDDSAWYTGDHYKTFTRMR
ncbi:ribonuclease domain-containing protein [Nocardia bovistercoris]|uniref:Ribonuclease n=1 Tax=Nocardia bovistercoris TaxID=2785916 RepID=A0A931IBJ2_9NOCA|nr:ribonuclease domain-containing protein [Nocardia bovistercoris]MBH0777478.1 ribonuclease [Nocardia bovistercoris]